MNICNNEILDLSPLSVLPSLSSLNAAQNHLHHIDSFFSAPQPALQLLQLDQNEIEYVFSNTMGGGGKKTKSSLSINLPNLYALTLSNNKLTSLLRAEDSLSDFMPHKNLAILDLSFNGLTSLEGLSLLPGLRILNLASNALERLEGVQQLKSLEKLNVSSNALLSLFVELNRLSSLPVLSSLILTHGNAAFVDELEQAAVAFATANPDAAQPPIDITSEILIVLPRLSFLDGRKVTLVQRRVADSLKKDRLAEAARRALEEEEAKRIIAEEEAAEAKRRKEEEEEEEKAKAEEEKEDEDKDSSDEKDTSATDDDHDTDPTDDATDAPLADDDPSGGDSFDDGAAGVDEPQGDEPADENGDGGVGPEPEEDAQEEEEEEDA